MLQADALSNTYESMCLQQQQGPEHTGMMAEEGGGSRAPGGESSGSFRDGGVDRERGHTSNGMASTSAHIFKPQVMKGAGRRFAWEAGDPLSGGSASF